MSKIRDRPYEVPDGKGVIYPLPRFEHVVIRFRPRVAAMSRFAARAGASGFEDRRHFRTLRPSSAVEPPRDRVSWKRPGR